MSNPFEIPAGDEQLPDTTEFCFWCDKQHQTISMVWEIVTIPEPIWEQYGTDVMRLVCTRCYGERHGYSPDETEQAGVADHVGEMDTQRTKVESPE